MHEQDSLAFVLLKEKYCPNCSFMEAMGKSNASFTWKSILEVQSVIEKGSRWRIGCEENVKVWGGRWLSTHSTLKVLRSMPLGMEDLQVSYFYKTVIIGVGIMIDWITCWGRVIRRSFLKFLLVQTHKG